MVFHKYLPPKQGLSFTYFFSLKFSCLGFDSKCTSTWSFPPSLPTTHTGSQVKTAKNHFVKFIPLLFLAEMLTGAWVAIGSSTHSLCIICSLPQSSTSFFNLQQPPNKLILFFLLFPHLGILCILSFPSSWEQPLAGKPSLFLQTLKISTFTTSFAHSHIWTFLTLCTCYLMHGLDLHSDMDASSSPSQ